MSNPFLVGRLAPRARQQGLPRDREKGVGQKRLSDPSAQLMYFALLILQASLLDSADGNSE